MEQFQIKQSIKPSSYDHINLSSQDVCLSSQMQRKQVNGGRKWSPLMLLFMACGVPVDKMLLRLSKHLTHDGLQNCPKDSFTFSWRCFLMSRINTEQVYFVVKYLAKNKHSFDILHAPCLCVRLCFIVLGIFHSSCLEITQYFLTDGNGGPFRWLPLTEMRWWAQHNMYFFSVWKTHWSTLPNEKS